MTPSDARTSIWHHAPVGAGVVVVVPVGLLTSVVAAGDDGVWVDPVVGGVVLLDAGDCDDGVVTET